MPYDKPGPNAVYPTPGSRGQDKWLPYLDRLDKDKDFDWYGDGPKAPPEIKDWKPGDPPKHKFKDWGDTPPHLYHKSPPRLLPELRGGLTKAEGEALHGELDAMRAYVEELEKMLVPDPVDFGDRTFWRNDGLDEWEYKFGEDNIKQRVETEELVQVNKDDQIFPPNLVSSRVRFGTDLHLPVIDIDIPCQLVPSTTKGHFHFYVNKIVPWVRYVRLLRAMAACGIVEPGYLRAAELRKATFVRMPHIKKPKGNRKDQW